MSLYELRYRHGADGRSGVMYLRAPGPKQARVMAGGFVPKGARITKVSELNMHKPALRSTTPRGRFAGN